MAANDFAVVIGVDRYLQRGNDLNNSVAGAVAFYKWLVNSAKVPDANIILLLSPNPGDPAVQGLDFGAATRRQDQQHDLAAPRRSNGFVGERFYFYYSGHGFTRRARSAPRTRSSRAITLRITTQSRSASIRSRRFSRTAHGSKPSSSFSIRAATRSKPASNSSTSTRSPVEKPHKPRLRSSKSSFLRLPCSCRRTTSREDSPRFYSTA